MVSYFPIPYPDEIFYSLCARYARRMPHTDGKLIMERLFGSKNVIATLELPSHLDFFTSALDCQQFLSTRAILSEHTMLPIYAPFFPNERLELIKKDMAGSCGMGIHMRSGIMPAHIKTPTTLRYCPLCLADDREIYGEGYWHRLFQATGNFVCPKHRIYLEDSPVNRGTNRSRHLFFHIDEVVSSSAYGKAVNRPPQILIDISNDLLWLLTNQTLIGQIGKIQNTYIHLLIQKGLAGKTGRIHSKKFLDKFNDFYKPGILEILGCSIRDAKDNWLLRLIHTRACAHPPVKHLLLIHFLNLNVKEFFELASQNQDLEQIKYSGSKTPVHQNNKKTHDPDWEKSLTQLWANSQISLREIGRRLNSDPLTVKRHATRLNLEYPRSGRRCSSLPAALALRMRRDISTSRSLYRNRWENVAKSNLNLGTKALRSLEPGTYSWLYRHDKEWLNSHKPAKAHSASPQRVNWETRDKEIAAMVDESAEMILRTPGKPVHITTTKIARQIGKLAIIQQHIDKLPVTRQKLAAVAESREQYAMRRIAWAMDQFAQEEHKPKKWELVKLSGTERLADRPAIKREIEKRLKSDQILSSSIS